MLSRNLLGANKILSNASVTYKTSAVSTSTVSTYTFNLTGTFEAGLCVIAVTAERATDENRVLSSVTFNTNPANSVVNTPLNGGGGNSLVSAIYAIRLGSTVTNPSIVTTFSNNMTRVGIASWIVQSAKDTPNQIQSSSIAGSSSSISNTLLSVGSNSVGIAVVTSGLYQTTNTWTNATARVTNRFASGTTGSFADFQGTPIGNYTVTSNSTAGSEDGQILVSATWR